jgi:hypothetical protein
VDDVRLERLERAEDGSDCAHVGDRRHRSPQRRDEGGSHLRVLQQVTHVSFARRQLPVNEKRLESMVAQTVREHGRLDRRAADVETRDDARDANHARL